MDFYFSFIKNRFKDKEVIKLNDRIIDRKDQWFIIDLKAKRNALSGRLHRLIELTYKIASYRL